MLAGSVAKRVSVKHFVYSRKVATVKADMGNEAEALIFVTWNGDRSTWQIECLKEVLRTVPVRLPMILMASCAPNDFLRVRDLLGSEDHILGRAKGRRVVYMANFEFTSDAFETAVGLMLG